MSDWKEVRKESKSYENGNLITTVQEPVKKQSWFTRYKDNLDFIFRLIGTLAVATPLFLFYNQYDREITKKRNTDLSQIYINISTDLEASKVNDINTNKYSSASENLIYKYPAELATFKIQPLTKQYDSITDIFKTYQYVKWFMDKKNRLEFYSLILRTYYWERLVLTSSNFETAKNYNKLDSTKFILDTAIYSKGEFKMKGVKSYAIKFNNVTKQEILSKIDTILAIEKPLWSNLSEFNNRARLSRNINYKLFDSDSTLSNLYADMDSTDFYTREFLSDLPDLTNYVKTSDQKTLMSFKELKWIDPYLFSNLIRLISKVDSSKTELEIRLEKKQKIFSNQILSLITN